MRQSALDILEVALRQRAQGPNLVERLETLEAAVALDANAEDKERNEPTKPFRAKSKKGPRQKVLRAVRDLLDGIREYRRTIVGSLTGQDRKELLIEIAVDENLARLQQGEPRLKTAEIAALFESMGAKMGEDNVRRTYKVPIDNKTTEYWQLIVLGRFHLPRSYEEEVNKEFEKKKQEPKVLRGPKHSRLD